jgi:hypothetical protein
MTDAKPVFTKLTASMTKDQKLRNLTAALEKSGFKVLPGRRPGGHQTDTTTSSNKNRSDR